jgi:hypothetical protein
LPSNVKRCSTAADPDRHLSNEMIHRWSGRDGVIGVV